MISHHRCRHVEVFSVYFSAEEASRWREDYKALNRRCAWLWVCSEHWLIRSRPWLSHPTSKPFFFPPLLFTQPLQQLQTERSDKSKSSSSTGLLLSSIFNTELKTLAASLTASPCVLVCLSVHKHQRPINQQRRASSLSAFWNEQIFAKRLTKHG